MIHEAHTGATAFPAGCTVHAGKGSVAHKDNHVEEMDEWINQDGNPESCANWQNNSAS